MPSVPAGVLARASAFVLVGAAHCVFAFVSAVAQPQTVPTQPSQPRSVQAAQQPAPQQDPAAATADQRRQTAAELDAISREIQTTVEREGQIRLEIEALEKDRARISEQLVATAARMRNLETQLGATEARIDKSDGEAAAIRRSLTARRALLADVLAALQRIGRKPPPAVLVRPEDALASIRSAILVGSLLPELRREAEALAADLEQLIRLRDRSAGERDRFRADLVSLVDEKSRLDLLLDERRRLKTDQQRRLDEERRRAGELASRATGLKDLIARFETEIDGARRGADAARRAEETRREDQNSVTAGAADPGRMQPAIAFAEAKGRLPLPVGGVQLRGFGEDDGQGGTMRGIQIAARSEARVTSPCDGWVVFAGPFRSYGKLLIINGGGGYHVLLAGMDRIDVELGQFLLAGEPVGVMGARRLANAAVGAPASTGVAYAPGGSGVNGTSGSSDLAAGQPVLYIEFRKENSSIDPTPWWVQSRDEKVRG